MDIRKFLGASTKSAAPTPSKKPIVIDDSDDEQDVVRVKPSVSAQVSAPLSKKSAPALGGTKRKQRPVSESSASDISSSSSSDDYSSDSSGSSSSSSSSSDSDSDSDGPRVKKRGAAATKKSITKTSPKRVTKTTKSATTTTKATKGVSSPALTPPAPTPKKAASTSAPRAKQAKTAATAVSGASSCPSDANVPLIDLAPILAALAQTAKPSGPPAWVTGKKQAPPPNLGMKPKPNGVSNCLSYGGGPKSNKPLTFVISGVLDSLDRDDAADWIKSLGGKCTTSVSGNTDYLLIGTEPGESKVKKAKDLGTKVIDEDGLFALVTGRSGGAAAQSQAPVVLASPSMPDTATTTTTTPSSDVVSTDITSPPAPATTAAKKGSLYARKAGSGASSTAALSTTSSTITTTTTTPAPGSSLAASNIPTPGMVYAGQGTPRLHTYPGTTEHDLWVDRYKPSRITDIVGNNTNVLEIVDWLRKWEGHLAAGHFEHKDGPKKAILLSGGPGIGKTTSAVLCAKEVGLHPIEFNASDTRSKTSVATEIAPLTQSRTMARFLTVKHNADGLSSAHNIKTSVIGNDVMETRYSTGNVLIMDEVDGMTASDRGGIAELIKIIKTSQTPIICICNDSKSDKIRSLKNYCIDLTWRRPTAAQIAKRMGQIAWSEGLKIEPNALDRLIQSTNSDIRQIINTLQIWSGIYTTPQYNGVVTYNTARNEADNNGKDIESNTFEVVPSLFSSAYPQGWFNVSLNKFFVASDLIPLFMQENYLDSRLNARYGEHRTLNAIKNDTFQRPSISKGKDTVNKPTTHNTTPNKGSKVASANTFSHINTRPKQYTDQQRNVLLMGLAADSISQGDLIGNAVMADQNFSLLPLHGAISTIYPGFIMGGGLTSFLRFPSLLGKTSSMNKMIRILVSIRSSLALMTSYMSRNDATLYYYPSFLSKCKQLLLNHTSLSQYSQQRILHEFQDDNGDVVDTPQQTHTAGALTSLQNTTGPQALARLLSYLCIMKDDYDVFTTLQDNLCLDKDSTYAKLIPTQTKTALTRCMDKPDVKRPKGKAQSLTLMATEDAELEEAVHETVAPEDDDDDDDDSDGPALSTASSRASSVTTTKGKAKAPSSRAKK